MSWLLVLFAATPHWTRADGAPADRAALRADDDACVRAHTRRLPGQSPEVDWSGWNRCMTEQGWVWVAPARADTRLATAR